MSAVNGVDHVNVSHANQIPNMVVSYPLFLSYRNIFSMITALAAFATSIIDPRTSCYATNKNYIDMKANHLEKCVNQACRKLMKFGVIFDGSHTPINLHLDNNIAPPELWNEFYMAEQEHINFKKLRSISGLGGIVKVYKDIFEQVAATARSFEGSVHYAGWQRSLQNLMKILQDLEKCNVCNTAILAKPAFLYTANDLHFLHKCRELRSVWAMTQVHE